MSLLTHLFAIVIIKQFKKHEKSRNIFSRNFRLRRYKISDFEQGLLIAGSKCNRDLLVAVVVVNEVADGVFLPASLT